MRDINQLHPRARELALKLQATCASQGIIIAIGECFRSVAEQDALYAQGRTKPGPKVTNCSGSTYSSMHQWGVAFDFYLKMDVDGDGSVSDDAFNDATGLFERVGAIGQSLGLEWGGSWTSIKDRPHFQLPDWGSTATRLKSTYGNFDNFKRTWGGSSSNSSTSNSVPAASPAPANPAYGIGTITASSGVNVRSAPDSSNPANKIGAIPNGKTVKIIKLNASNSGGLTWAQISYGNITGYVAQKYINITKYPKDTTKGTTSYSKSAVDSAASENPALAGTYKTTANLNLRTGAGTKKDIILTIPKGGSVQNYGFYTTCGGTQWLLVAYGKYEGFVSTGYLKKK